MDDMTPEERHRNMQHIRSKDTKPELVLRKCLWHAGFRYRKNVKNRKRIINRCIEKTMDL